MSFSTPLRIIAAALLCALSLIGLVIYEGQARASGTEVILRMEAIDPRSLLSGHYVILNFQELLGQNGVCPPGTTDQASFPRNGVEIAGWTALAPRGDHHSVAGAGASRDDAARHGPVIVHASVFCTPPRAPAENDPGFAGAVRLDIGVDRFHIDRAQAERIERVLREQRPGGENRVSAIVSVGRDGRARLKGLIVDGQRVELNWT